MTRPHDRARRFCARTGGAVLFLLATATAGAPLARAEGTGGGAAPPPPSAAAASTNGKADVKPAPGPRAEAKSGQPARVKENVKGMSKEASDPSTLQRIKAREQELEKKIERTRDRQRADHGTAKPADAVDLAKSLDDPDDAAPGSSKAKGPAGAKPDGAGGTKREATPSAPGKTTTKPTLSR